MKRIQSVQSFHRMPVPRSEEMSDEQLCHYAQTLAGVHRVSATKTTKQPTTPVLLKRLSENVKVCVCE